MSTFWKAAIAMAVIAALTYTEEHSLIRYSIGALAAIVFLGIVSRRVVLRDHYGFVTTFGRRGRIVGEGWHFVIPIFQDVEYLAKDEKIPIAIKVSAFSKDNLQLILEGKAFVKPDAQPDTKHNLLNEFLKVSWENISSMVADAVKQELGIIAGNHTGPEFISRREAIQLLIDCVLRLSKAPHIEPWEFDPALTGEIPPDERLAFYAKHSQEIRRKLDKETENHDDYSRMELLLGIDIAGFALANVDFSEEVKKAMEEARKAQGEVDAAKQKNAFRQAVYDELVRKGVDPATAAAYSANAVKEAPLPNHYIASGINIADIVAGLGKLMPPPPPAGGPRRPVTRKRKPATRKPTPMPPAGHGHKPGCPGLHCPGCSGGSATP